jgi:hypothetical protein
MNEQGRVLLRGGAHAAAEAWQDAVVIAFD